MRTTGIVLLFLLLFIRCKTTAPITAGDPIDAVSYGYQPLDPLPVDVRINNKVIDPLTERAAILNALGDETMRIVIGEVEGAGQISYGSSKMGYEGRSYVVVIDYMKFQTYPKLFRYSQDSAAVKIYTLIEQVPDGKMIKQRFLPMYIGVGLRLSANIKVNKGSVDLGNLFLLGMAAQENRVTGSLVIQTLGISGDKITDLLPMPTEISPTAIQNAITALATIKSKIHDADTRISPRTIGFYNVLGGGKETVSDLISICLTGNAILDLPG